MHACNSALLQWGRHLGLVQHAVTDPGAWPSGTYFTEEETEVSSAHTGQVRKDGPEV